MALLRAVVIMYTCIAKLLFYVNLYCIKCIVILCRAYNYPK